MRGLTCTCVGYLFLTAVQAACGQPVASEFSELTSQSVLTSERCLPPCRCSQGPVTTTLAGGLVFVAEAEEPLAYFRFGVRQVHWEAQTPQGPVILTGSGIYEVFGDFVLQERLQLDLSINGEPAQRFDTGVVTAGGDLVAVGPQVGCTRYAINVRWQPRCGADYNADDFVNPDDLSDYISGFFASPSDPRSDFNLDGLVDPDDLSDFIVEFFFGCG